MEAEELLRDGKLDEALAGLQEQVRNDPSKAELRVFLFQLLAVMGDWKRAMTQLNVAAEMDASRLLLAEVCRPALNSEALRTEIFAGRRKPLIFGEPEEWVSWMVRALELSAEGEYSAAQELREQAFEAAPAIGGKVGETAFEWIADADTRLGPILEAVVEGRYFWVPFPRVRQIEVTEPTALRDLVWLPVNFTWDNGGQAPGLIPTRYVGSEASAEPMVRLARRTEWTEHPGELFVGLGQRMFATDGGEYPLLEVREIVLDHGD